MKFPDSREAERRSEIMDRRETVSIAKRLKERKVQEFGIKQGKEYAEVEQKIKDKYNEKCRPIVLRLNKSIEKAKSEIKAMYGEERISDYNFPRPLDTKSPHTVVSGYTKEETKSMDSIREKYRDKENILQTAFDEFEMKVLTTGAEGALKEFIDAMKHL